MNSLKLVVGKIIQQCGKSSDTDSQETGRFGGGTLNPAWESKEEKDFL